MGTIKNFNRYIVLEDFHYLPTEAQKDFAVALKAFHEASQICFIVVGVWAWKRIVSFRQGCTAGIKSLNSSDVVIADPGHVIRRRGQTDSKAFCCLIGLSGEGELRHHSLHWTAGVLAGEWPTFADTASRRSCCRTC